jgi:hypothetical protein
MCDSAIGRTLAIIQHTRIYGKFCYKSPKKTTTAKPWKKMDVAHEVTDHEVKGTGSGSQPRIKADIKGIMSSTWIPDNSLIISSTATRLI